jgi:hypothetical protein
MDTKLKVDCTQVPLKREVVEIVSSTPTVYSPASVIDTVSSIPLDDSNTTSKTTQVTSNKKWSISKLSTYSRS